MSEEKREKQEFAHEYASTSSEFEEFRKKMQDPVVVGAMLHRLTEERESANLVLKQINEKLDKLLAVEERLKSLEQKLAATAPAPAKGLPRELLLPEVDEEILAFVRKRGKACAEEVQAKFGYKGRNAASSRLNRLCDAGVLGKAQVGRKVFFIAKQR